MMQHSRTHTAGFTLVETLVVLVLTGIVAAGLYQMLYAGRRSHDINQNQVEMQQNARIAVSSLTEEFRHVSYGKDPTQPSIHYAGAESLVYIADMMTEIPGAETISFYLDPDGDADTPNPTDTRLMKAVADSGGNVLYVEPQSYGIAQNGLLLTYFNGTGTPLASPVAQPELIGEMGIEVTATESRRWKQQPYSTLTLGATVYPRNLPLTPARSRPSSPLCQTPVFPNCSSVTLRWETPTTNTDGTELPFEDISHFNLFFGLDVEEMELFGRLARTLNEWTIPDLGCETYYIGVSCVSRSGVESYPCRREANVTAGSRPKPPASLASIDSLGIKLEWPQVTQFENEEPITVALDYRVYRDVVSGFIPDDTNLIATTSATEYYDALPNDCAEYYYRVCAKACCELGDPSPEAYGSRPSPPQCPTDLAGEPGGVEGQLHITWEHPTHRGDFTPLGPEDIACTWIYCDTIPGSTNVFAVVEGNTTSATLKYLLSCETYYIHARTVDVCGHPSDSQCFSNEVFVSTSSPCDPEIPDPPGWLTVEALDDQVDLAWPANETDCDLRGYRIYYGGASGVYDGVDADQGYSPIDVRDYEVTYGGTCHISLTGLEGCQPIYAAVVVTDWCEPPNESPRSPEASGTTDCTPCLIQASCPTWIASAAEQYKDLHLEVYTENGSDETLAKLVANWSAPAQVVQVLYGRPLVQVWNADGTAGEDGAVGPQGSGAVLDLDDVTVPVWTSPADGQPLALVFDEDVSNVGFDLEFKDATGSFCTANGLNRSAAIFDDFDDGNINGWIVRSGVWSSDNHELYQPSTSGARILVSEQVFGDMTYEAKVKMETGTTTYILFRYTDDYNFYLFGLRSSNSTVRLARYSNGVFTQTAYASVPIQEDRWYNLKVVAAGSSIVAYLDCEPVMEYTDAYMKPFGRIGFRTYYTATRFDDIRCRNVAQLP